MIYFVQRKEKSIVLCGIMTFRVSLDHPTLILIAIAAFSGGSPLSLIWCGLMIRFILNDFHNLFQHNMMWVSWGLACYDHFQTTDNSTSNDWKPSRKITLLPLHFKWAHIEVITVVFASVIEKDFRPQMTENHQGKWLSCYLTHKNMELSATTPQSPRECFA